MMDILKYLMENSDERFTKQIQYIMDQLSMDPSKDNKSEMSKSQALSESNDEDNDVDDLDEDDDLVEEEELEESIHLEKSFPLGEELLAKYFLLPSEAGEKQNNMIRSLMKDQQKSLNVSRVHDKSLENVNSNMFKRPTTPSLVSNNHSVVEVNKENNRDIPSELRARPKIVRTPLEGGGKHSNVFEQSNEETKENIAQNNSSVQGKGLLYVDSPFMNEKKIELRVNFPNLSIFFDFLNFFFFQ